MTTSILNSNLLWKVACPLIGAAVVSQWSPFGGIGNAVTHATSALLYGACGYGAAMIHQNLSGSGTGREIKNSVTIYINGEKVAVGNPEQIKEIAEAVFNQMQGHQA